MNDRLHVWYAAHSLADAGQPESDQTIRIGYAIAGPLAADAPANP